MKSLIGPQGPAGPEGPRGVDIKDIYWNENKELIISQSNDIDFNVGDIRGEKGADGKDAEPLDYDRVSKKLAGLVSEAVAKIPAPADGNKIYFGEGPPAAKRKTGDVYIDKRNWNVYQSD